MNPNGQPAAVLTARSLPDPESTKLASSVSVVWPPSGFVVGKSFVIFIHGFNDEYMEARYFYAAFRQLLNAPRIPRANFAAEVVEFHWPGDAGAKFKLFSTLAYAADIAPALTSGELLADWIIQNTDPGARIVLLGHSMGARVVLNAVRKLRQNRQLQRISAAAIMAAAVPVDSITPANLGPNPSDGVQWLVLHSSDDDVLKWAFPPGETTGGQGFFPQAVGRAGQPFEAWKAAFGTQDMGYGHSDYWFGGAYEPPNAKEIAAAPGTFAPLPLTDVVLSKSRDNQSVNFVLRLLNASPPASIASNAIPTSSALASNTIAGHQVGQGPA